MKVKKRKSVAIRIAEAVLAERERCAKVAEQCWVWNSGMFIDAAHRGSAEARLQIAGKIRSGREPDDHGEG